MIRERVLNGFNCMALFLKLSYGTELSFVFYSIVVYVLCMC